MKEFKAQYPSAYDSVGRARRAIVAFASEWFGGNDLIDIESSVGEALANCAEHGHRHAGKIDISCRYWHDELSIDIQDAGSGFESWNAPCGGSLSANAARGYGLYIMRRLMDDMEFTERGTRLRLVKRRPAEHDAEAVEPARRRDFSY